jgi:hypothetical protein
MAKRYLVTLTEDERARLLTLTKKGKVSARQLTRAHILGGQRKLDGKQEAFLIALACSTPPEGRTSWTMPLLAHKLVELRVIDAISDETVRRTLKKPRSSRGSKRPGVFRA